MAAIDFSCERFDFGVSLVPVPLPPTYETWCKNAVIAERCGGAPWPASWTFDRIERARVVGLIELGEVGT